MGFFNESNTVLGDLDKYSDLRDDRCCWCSLFDGGSILRTTQKDIRVINKTNVAILGYIQPSFFINDLQPSKEPEGLFKRYLISCPMAHSKKLNECYDISDDDYFKVIKIWG